MPVDFLSAGFQVLSWGATYLVHSTILLGGVWFFLALRRTAGHSFREALWKTALVGGVVTASIQMLLVPRGPFGEVTFAVEVTRPDTTTGTSVTPDVQSVVSSASDRKTSVASGATHGEIDVSEVPSESGLDIVIATDLAAIETMSISEERGSFNSDPAKGSVSPRKGTSWRIVFGDEIRRIPVAAALAISVFMALAAVALGILGCAWQSFSLQWKLKGCSVINSGPARRLLDELCVNLPRTPEVLLLAAPDDPEPAAFGIRKWTIVLPERAAHELPQDELRVLLAHELAHLVRGDSIWLFVSRIFCSCLAFQPLNHLARREWQRAAEFLCDGWAVSRTGTPLALARCLTEVAGWRLSGRPSAAILAATGRKSGLVDRIERLLGASERTDMWNELRQSRRLVPAGVIVLGLLAWCAPRVQLAAAAADRAQFERARFNTSLTDSAKPQAYDDGTPTADDSLETAPALPSVETASRADDAPLSDVALLLEALDRDLSALNSELKELEPLLLKQGASPPLMLLAGRIRVEIVRLTERRDALRAHWKREVH